MTCTRIFLGILSLAVLATLALAAQEQPAPSCEQWNTKAFFQTATVEAVTACLAAGADVAARDEDEITPLGTVKLTDLVPNQRLGKSLSC